jgi:hypothetical protein
MILNRKPVSVGFCCAIVVCVFFLPFFRSGGDLISGDLGDNRLLIALLEHWRAWVEGQASFADANFFAPARGTLGYSDALALYAPAYLTWRAAGFDPYLSFQFTLIFVKLIGFLSYSYFLEIVLRLSRTAALFGAGLFTLSSMYFTSLGHSQLASLAFLPLVGLLGVQSWRLRERQLLSHALSGAAGLLLSLVFLTGYQIAFFFVLSCTAALSIYLVLECWRNPAGVRRSLWQQGKPLASRLAAAGAALAVGMTPFVLLYAPVLRLTGGRAFPDVDTQILGTIQIISPGPTNAVWGGILNQFPGLFQLDVPREIGRGWAPITFVLFVLASIRFIGAGVRRESTSQQRLLAALCLSVFVLTLAATRLGGLMPWRLVYEIFPGAKGVRVAGRVNLVLNLVVVALVVDYIRRRLHQPGVRLDLGHRIRLVGLCAILLIEQLNWDAFPGFSRRQELAALRRISAPPARCRTFYVSRSDRPNSAARQIDAMLLARRFNLPTINGYSGLEPPGWKCPGDNAHACEALLLAWASSHGLMDGLCALDMTSGQWSGPAAPAAMPSH